MAEWLRRLTRNQMGSSRVGSNPTCSELVCGRSKHVQGRYQLHAFEATVRLSDLSGQPMIAAMAEWLRRLTRNQMGSSRVGSNPTRSEWIQTYKKWIIGRKLFGKRS